MASSEEPHGLTQRDGCSAILVPEAFSPCSEMSSSALQPLEVGTVVMALADPVDPAPEAAASEALPSAEPAAWGVHAWDARHGVGACAVGDESEMGDELDIHSGYASSTCEEEEVEAFTIDAASAAADAADAADADASADAASTSAATSAASSAAEGVGIEGAAVRQHAHRAAARQCGTPSSQGRAAPGRHCGGAAGRQHGGAAGRQCGGAAVRQCGTPGCELAAYHEGPCQSQQVVWGAPG